MENSVDSTPAGDVEAETSTHIEPMQQVAQEEVNERDSKTEESAEDDLMRKAHDMLDSIIETRSAPSPRLLHALASMLEQEEARFIQESGLSSSNNARSSHNVGRLGNLLRENDEFFELVSSKFLSDARYTTGVRAAAGRLILACASTWVYPYVFEDDVLENIKHWAMDDMLASGEDCSLRLEASGQVASDPLMLKTYATGLLALALHGNGPVVEDVLTSGLAAKLMRFLRMRVFGEMNAGQKDVSLVPENRQSVGGNSGRVRDDGKSRLRHMADISRLDFVRLSEETIAEEQIVDKDNEKGMSIKEKCAEDYLEDDDELKRAKDAVDVLDEVTGILHVEDDNIDHTPEDKRRRKEWREVMCKFSGNKSLKDEDGEENLREDPSKRRAERGVSRHRGKARASEGVAEAEKCMTASGTGIRLGSQVRTNKDRTSSKLDTNLDHRIKQDGKLSDVGHVSSDKDEIDDSDKVCKVGTKDISEIVKRARRAAEAEARGANAPIAAVKAAGDAAAELVKTTATEVLSNTNDEEAAFEAASTAATTVVDAALSTDVSRKGNDIIDKGHDVVPSVFERECELEANLILDSESIGRLREQFCVQCLERLGEYVEVLGPVLHEKGVDVCLALLQRHSKADDSSKTMLSDVLKLICALAAHRKFTALFVDRGGVQKLLAVPRVSESFSGISMCLFAIGSHQAIMERVCALPLDIVHTVVQLALQLLDCSQDHARKHAALFFGVSFVFRAVLEAFDANDGLQKMLNLLRNAANIRSGVGNAASGMSGTSPRIDRTSAEVLTVAEKQIAYHTCVALRIYFRAQLILLVDTLRPNKGHRGGARSAPNTRAAYKPIDISNEAVEAVFLQLQRDRKIGPAFVRARWPAVEKFLSCNGYTILLELSQAPAGERYLHDLALYALGVLHIVTLVPNARRLVVGATLSNERLGMAVILDAASGASHVEPEVIQAALLVLVNLVCPPPSLSSKPVSTFQGTNVPLSQAPNGSLSEGKERNVDRNTVERTLPLLGQDEARDRNSDQNNNGERNGLAAQVIFPGSSQVAASSPTAVLVGDRRISLGPGAGCAGLAAYMEQGYRQAREAVRANNGIKVLLHLLHPRTLLNPNILDFIRAIACRVLLGLAKDDTIAHILTKLQVGKLLSELVRDAGSQIAGATGEQGKYQAELSQLAMELIAIVTNAGRASTLAATDAAAPTLRRIERAAIAAATPITYHSKELLQLIHEHLVASGLSNSAATLLKEAHLTPLPSLAAPSSLPHRTSVQEASGEQSQWPSGRVPGGFLTDPSSSVNADDCSIKSDLSLCSLRKKSLSFSSNICAHVKTPQATQQLTNKAAGAKDTRNTSGSTKSLEFCTPIPKLNSEVPDLCLKSPNTLPIKRKAFDRDTAFPLSSKRLAITDPGNSSPIYMTPTVRKSNLSVEIEGTSGTPSYCQRDKVDDIACNQQILGSYHGTPCVGQVSSYYSQPGLLADPQSGNNERATLDSLVVQYLKHQHRQCPAPITTLPPLSLLHPHVCPEPSGALDAPFNTAGRLSTREFRTQYGGMHGHRRDRQFVFSRFRPWRTCRDDAALLTSITFLDGSSRIATGSHMGELKIFDTSTGNVLESHVCHQSPVTLVECSSCGNCSSLGSKLLLSSGNFDVRLWDSSAIGSGPLHAFENCRAARFNHSGNMFAAISLDTSHREILLYDVQSGKLEQTLSDSSSGSSGFIRSQTQSVVHFSPSDAMLLCNGVLWDHRVPRHVHRFDQFSDYGGGGFHPAGNEVIINSEVWDLRKFRLLRSVPSLDQTVITFNPTGDIIYATLRRNLEDIMTALHPRRTRNPLYKAFRTMDAVHYSDIATTGVDRCVLDLATEPTDSFIGLVTMDDSEEMDASARIFEVGRRRPTEDDSDPDDVLESDEEDEGESEADEEEGEDGLDDGESDIDISNDEDDSVDEGEDADFDSNDEDGMAGIVEIISDDDGSHGMGGSFSSEDEGSMGEFDDEFLII